MGMPAVSFGHNRGSNCNSNAESFQKVNSELCLATVSNSDGDSHEEGPVGTNCGSDGNAAATGPGEQFKHNKALSQSHSHCSQGLLDTRFSWLGMSDHYIAIICLGLALRLYNERYDTHVLKASQILGDGMDLLGEGSLLIDVVNCPKRLRLRSIQTFAVHNVKQRFFSSLAPEESVTQDMF